MEYITLEMDRENRLMTAEMLLAEQQHELALEVLEPLNCVLAEWLKGRVYYEEAEKIASSFAFKHGYVTDAAMHNYRTVLHRAYKHFHRTGDLLPKAAREIQDRLNSIFWYQLGRVENELARTRPQEDELPEEDYICEREDFAMHEAQHVDSVVDRLTYWNLKHSE